MKKIVSILLLLAMSFTLGACGQQNTVQTNADSSAGESDWEYISQKGEMTIGITLFSPMNYKDGDELTGFETEFATAVCEKLGVTPNFQEIDWGSKEIELNSKNIDCIWNGMTITDDRKENMSVTKPYMNNRQVMVIKKENLDKFSQNVDGASVVAEVDSTGDHLATTDEFFKNTTYASVDSQAKALMDVAAGTSDVAIVDYVTSIGSIGEGTDYEDLILTEPKQFSVDEYGVAFRKGSDVTAKVEEAMQELANEGKLEELAKKYKLDDLLILKKAD